MAIRNEYNEGDVTRAIVDILNLDWPLHLKRHLLIKELLWNVDYPRGVFGSWKIEHPAFSREAKKIWVGNIKEGKKGRTGLVFEHAIPRSILFDMIVAEKYDFQSIREFQERYIRRAFVTVEEDKKLNKKGLRSKMPEGWDGVDVWARHAAVRIQHVDWLPPDAELLLELQKIQI